MKLNFSSRIVGLLYGVATGLVSGTLGFFYIYVTNDEFDVNGFTTVFLSILTLGSIFGFIFGVRGVDNLYDKMWEARHWRTKEKLELAKKESIRKEKSRENYKFDISVKLAESGETICTRCKNYRDTYQTCSVFKKTVDKLVVRECIKFIE